MLTIYRRRHDPKCLALLAKKGITDKKLLTQYRGRDCRCAYWIRGVTDYGKIIKPRSLKAYTLEAASDRAREYNREDAVEEIGITVEEAAKRWLAELRLAEKSPATLHQYEYTVGLLVGWCNRLPPPIHELAKVHPPVLNDLRDSWVSKGIARNTHRNRMGWLTAFFNFAERMGWINENPADKMIRVRKPRPQDEEQDEATMPLDVEGDTNYRKLLAAIPEYLTGRIGVRESKKAHPNPYPIRARTSPLGSRPGHLVALAELMYETGLRVSDAVFFRVDDMVVEDDGAVYTAQQIKTGHEVTVYPPLWLAEKLRKLEKLSAHHIFIDKQGVKDWKPYIVNNVYAYLRGAGEAVGIPGVRPHRFRDSFAVNRLNEGLLLEDLQRLLGHRSLETTERYYSPFVKSRQDRLKARVLAARNTRKEATPPNVVPITTKLG